MIDAILFDFDGTLIDSAPGVAWSLNKALAEEGRATLSINRVKDLVGKGALHLVTDALVDTGGMRDTVQRDRVEERFLQIYSENPVQDTIIFPGAIEVLQALQDQQMPMALCTNKPRKTTIPVLDVFDMKKYFPTIVCGDDVINKKPDGRHLFDTLTAMGLPHAIAIMVGDSENDILAAHDAKMASICVSFGYCHMPFDELKPTILINHFSDFSDALAELQRQAL
jgi:phosphoglycolate phosphatase